MPLDNVRKFAKKTDKPLILVTNDDGIDAEGINTLVAALAGIGRVVVAAPSKEQSASSHAITLHRPIYIEERGVDRWAIGGTPVDCVNLALNFLLDARPDLIMSGINHGGNVGEDVHYSGTVSAALEGGVLGVPSIAMSVIPSFGNLKPAKFHFEGAAKFAVHAAHAILNAKLSDTPVLNVNVPNVPMAEITGAVITKQGTRHYNDVVNEHIDENGKKYLVICGTDGGFKDEEGTDCWAVHRNLISIVPIRVDMTDESAQASLRGLKELTTWK